VVRAASGWRWRQLWQRTPKFPRRPCFVVSELQRADSRFGVWRHSFIAACLTFAHSPGGEHVSERNMFLLQQDGGHVVGSRF
jgi:hypothetical protein